MSVCWILSAPINSLDFCSFSIWVLIESGTNIFCIFFVLTILIRFVTSFIVALVFEKSTFSIDSTAPPRKSRLSRRLLLFIPPETFRLLFLDPPGTTCAEPTPLKYATKSTSIFGQLLNFNKVIFVLLVIKFGMLSRRMQLSTSKEFITVPVYVIVVRAFMFFALTEVTVSGMVKFVITRKLSTV